MAILLRYAGVRPKLGRNVFVAPTAVVTGDVELGDDANVWFGAVLRGDVGSIRIGPRTNIQDLACVHVTGATADGAAQANAVVGADVTVGHNAVLHGCTVGDGCLIGMGSIVLDHARIGERAVVAAGTLVPPNMVVPPRTLVRGSPARVVGEASAAQEKLGLAGAEHYVELARRYGRELACLGCTEEIKTMQVRVNGESMELAAGLTIRALIEQLGLGPGPVAAELNGEVVPRSDQPTIVLHSGDALELVHFTGGG